ncbi:MAG: hypothetical protein OQJ89_10615, partial [Kangiellaceae bacterium]|nr:hypothetical protein [Kangiellaceae bacterium]
QTALFIEWELNKVKKYFLMAAKLEPNSIPVLHDLAVVATIQGNFELAEDSIKKALNIDPGRFQEHYHAEWFYQVANKYELALK